MHSTSGSRVEAESPSAWEPHFGIYYLASYERPIGNILFYAECSPREFTVHKMREEKITASNCLVKWAILAKSYYILSTNKCSVNNEFVGTQSTNRNVLFLLEGSGGIWEPKSTASRPVRCGAAEVTERRRRFRVARRHVLSDYVVTWNIFQICHPTI